MIRARFIAAAAVLWVGCCPARADEPYVLLITQWRGKDGSGTGSCSATLVGWTTDCSKGIFLSCGHGYDPYRPVNVHVGEGKTVDGKIIAINREFDLSLIEVPVEGSHSIVKLAENSPRECDEVGLMGFPGKKFVRKSTRVSGRFWSRCACTNSWSLYDAAPNTECPPGHQKLLVTEAASAPGLSGGCMLSNQKLAGVVVGRVRNAQDAALVVPAETVRLFIHRNIALFYRG
jgi:hypothetical protein